MYVRVPQTRAKQGYSVLALVQGLGDLSLACSEAVFWFSDTLKDSVTWEARTLATGSGAKDGVGMLFSSLLRNNSSKQQEEPGSSTTSGQFCNGLTQAWKTPYRFHIAKQSDDKDHPKVLLYFPCKF